MIDVDDIKSIIMKSHVLLFWTHLKMLQFIFDKIYDIFKWEKKDAKKAFCPLSIVQFTYLNLRYSSLIFWHVADIIPPRILFLGL